MAERMPPEVVEQMNETRRRFERVYDLLVDQRVHLPMTVVHAHRVD
jgi:hypothetical protein